MADSISGSGGQPQIPSTPSSVGARAPHPPADPSLMDIASFEENDAAASSPTENAFDFLTESKKEISPGDRILQGLEKLSKARDL